MIVLIQGENFRPNKVEAIVDDMLSIFSQGLSKITDYEFDQTKQKIFNQLYWLPDSLEDVSEKLNEAIEQELLNPKEKSYLEIKDDITKKSLKIFAEKLFFKESQRLTIELFSKGMSEEERHFVTPRAFNLNQRNYEIVSLEKMMEKKNKE